MRTHIATTGHLQLLAAFLLLSTSDLKSWAFGAEQSKVDGSLRTELWSGDVIPCSRASEQSEMLSGPQLFQSAMACIEEGNSFDGTFLLIAGQIRASTDLSLLPALGDLDEIAMGELYGAIFYRFGGVGDQSILRDPERTKRLFDRLELWRPSFHEGYKPGWNYKSSSKQALYGQVASEHMKHRLSQLKSFAVLISNDEYYTAKKEMDEISRRNRGAIPTDSADGKRMSELSALMARIADRLERPSLTEAQPSVLDTYQPDPDADFTQVFVGFNGPESSSAETFWSAAAARESWLLDAIGIDALERALSQVDFGSQVLVVLAIGERERRPRVPCT